MGAGGGIQPPLVYSPCPINLPEEPLSGTETSPARGSPPPLSTGVSVHAASPCDAKVFPVPLLAHGDLGGWWCCTPFPWPIGTEAGAALRVSPLCPRSAGERASDHQVLPLPGQARRLGVGAELRHHRAQQPLLPPALHRQRQLRPHVSQPGGRAKLRGVERSRAPGVAGDGAVSSSAGPGPGGRSSRPPLPPDHCC